MRDWAIWYRNLVVAWVVIGLPSVVIGYGMGGGDLEIPNADDGLASVLTWVLAVTLLASPFLLWPFRSTGRKEGFD